MNGQFSVCPASPPLLQDNSGPLLLLDVVMSSCGMRSPVVLVMGGCLLAGAGQNDGGKWRGERPSWGRWLQLQGNCMQCEIVGCRGIQIEGGLHGNYNCGGRATIIEGGLQENYN